ncbi:hypothetical protein K3495_g7464 [Podosphaera aphanis]|nr:hypothetical protein K3495_g7464 [Podosphaera aphanis]
MADSQMALDSGNDALPTHLAWQRLAESWDQIATNTTLRRFALPFNLSRAIQIYLSHAYAAGKASFGNSDDIDFAELYPQEATDLQFRLIVEAVSLGQGVSLEASRPNFAHDANAPPPSEIPELLPQPSSVPHLAKPDKFERTRSKCNAFATSMPIRFRANPTDFPTEESQIIFTVTYLTDIAYSWFEPHVDSTTGKISYSTYDEFMEALGAAFDDPDSYATAERDVEAVRQAGSCVAYYAKIVSIFSRFG